MYDSKCTGEKCKDCPYCKKHGDKLYEDMLTAKWRYGLAIAVIVVALLSIGIDIVTLIIK